MNKKIGVVVPVYKVEKYICECVDSILAQSYNNLEIVLVDDGSPDNCPQICDYYATLDQRIKVIHKLNEGLVSAWMCGINNLSDEVEYVVFVDSDDWISSKYIEILVSELNKHSADVVLTKMCRSIGEKNTIRELKIKAGFYNDLMIKTKIFPQMLNMGGFEERGLNTSRCAKILKKSLIEKNLKYCEKVTTYAEDLNIIFPVYLSMNSLSIIDNNECLYFYRVNNVSMLHTYDNKMLQSIMHVHSALIYACKDYGAEELDWQVYADFLAAAVQYYKNELKNPHGLSVGKKNIEVFCENEMLKYAIKNVDWSLYKNLNKIIIRCLGDFGFMSKNFITFGMYCLMKLKLYIS